MDDSYFYTFKMRFEWEDREKKILTCGCRLNNSEENDLNRPKALIKINLKDNEIQFLTKGNFDIKMPEDDFRKFILKTANRWVEKQLG
jgi:hypothetical protein